MRLHPRPLRRRCPTRLGAALVLALVMAGCTADPEAPTVAEPAVTPTGPTDVPASPPSPASAATGTTGTTGTTDADADPADAGPTPTEPAATPAPTPLEITPLTDPVTTAGLPPFADDDGDAWAQQVPEAVDLRIGSTVDGQAQPAYWVAPDAPGRPLLLVLHSWSTGYDQQLSIPYARWAADNGWGMIAPDFRGVNERPEATGSDLAVADVLDAIDWALAEGGGAPDAVVAVGFSGGAMMSLLMAGRHPDRLAAAIAWVPIHDLGEWYAWNVREAPDRSYVEEIEASCGGPPDPGTAAAEECAARSPSAWLDRAREAELPIYLGVGLDDDIVPAGDGARAFDDLADPGDRFGEPAIAALDQAALPVDAGVPDRAVARFTEAEPEVLLTRRSGSATFVLFDGEHEMLYRPGIDWAADVLSDSG